MRKQLWVAVLLYILIYCAMDVVSFSTICLNIIYYQNSGLGEYYILTSHKMTPN